MEYSYAEFIFAPDSDPALIPAPEEALELLKTGITVDYILDVVRPFVTTPFASTNEVILRAVDCQAEQP